MRGRKLRGVKGEEGVAVTDNLVRISEVIMCIADVCVAFYWGVMKCVVTMTGSSVEWVAVTR